MNENQVNADYTMVRAVEQLEADLIPFISEFVQRYGFMPTVAALPNQKRGTGFSFTVEVTDLKPPMRALRGVEEDAS